MDVCEGLVRYVVTVQSKSRELTQEGAIMRTSRATKLEISVRPKWCRPKFHRRRVERARFESRMPGSVSTIHYIFAVGYKNNSDMTAVKNANILPKEVEKENDSGRLWR